MGTSNCRLGNGHSVGGKPMNSGMENGPTKHISGVDIRYGYVAGLVSLAERSLVNMRQLEC